MTVTVVLASCQNPLAGRLEQLDPDNDGVASQRYNEIHDLPSLLQAVPRPTPPASAWAAETDADYSKGMIRWRGALERSEPLSGAGITIGVLDTGLSIAVHPELPRSRVTTSRYISGLNGKNEPVAEHGTAVASVLAASRDGYGIHGVAYGAQVRIERPDNLLLESNTVVSLQGLSDNDAALASHLSWGHQFQVVNNSWALSPGINYREPDATTRPAGSMRYTESALRHVLPQTIRAVAQADRAPEDRTIYVWSAGNAGNKKELFPETPLLLGALPLRIRELMGHWLAVVSVNENGEISGFSNHCGAAQAFCLAAPGELIRAPLLSYDPDPSREAVYAGGAWYGNFSGTSFSAPMVSGALALIIEAFKGMGNTWAVTRLLETANKEAPYDNPDIYGQGLLDITAAVQPVGKLAVPVGGGRIPLQSLLGLVSGAFGGASGPQRLMALDSLGAPFWFSFTELGDAPALPTGSALTAAPALLQMDAFEAGWTLTSRAPDGSTGLALSHQTGTANLLWSVGADPALLLAARGTDRALAAGQLSPWLGLLDSADGMGVSLAIGRSQWSMALFEGQVLPADPIRPEHGVDHSVMLDWQLIMPGYHWQIQAGQTEEMRSVRGLQLPGSAAGQTTWAGVNFGYDLAPNWQVQVALHLADSRVRLTRPILLQSLEIEPALAAAASLSVRSVLTSSDHLWLQVGTSPGQAKGLGHWQVPDSMYRGQVQFAEYFNAVEIAPNRHWTLGYRLDMGRAALGFHFGRGGVGDHRRPSGDWTSLSLQLPL